MPLHSQHTFDPCQHGFCRNLTTSTLVSSLFTLKSSGLWPLQHGQESSKPAFNPQLSVGTSDSVSLSEKKWKSNSRDRTQKMSIRWHDGITTSIKAGPVAHLPAISRGSVSFMGTEENAMLKHTRVPYSCLCLCWIMRKLRKRQIDREDYSQVVLSLVVVTYSHIKHPKLWSPECCLF